MDRRIRIGLSFLVMAAPFLLAACGGGGGGGGVAPQPPPAANIVTKFASLDNTQETTGSLSPSKGFGVLALNTDTNGIAGFVVDNVANGTAAHIHGSAARGVEAGVLVPLVGAGPGLWVIPDGTTLPAANVADFNNGLLYFNVHTAVNPGGEIRGQIDMTPTAVKFASLDNTQEATGSQSPSKGFALLAFDSATSRIAGAIHDNVAAGTAAHIHGPAARGADAGVLVPMIGAGPGLWVLPDGALLPAANVADFNNDLLYYNVHTAINPGGEIRGQIDMTPTAVKFASLNSAQETTASQSPSLGAGVLAFDSVSLRIAGGVHDNVANPTAAHIHGPAARGVEAGVLVPLIGADPGLWVLPDGALLPAANEADFNNGLLYYNVHTAVNPGGEIRGQIDLP